MYRDSYAYNIDIVFVIDATGSMMPVIEQFKERILTFPVALEKKMEADGKHIKALRIKIVDFADFATEGRDAIHASEFFTFPEGSEQLKKYLNQITCENRGGDSPENALEALWVAMNSDWVDLSCGKLGNHIIVLITDAPPLDLQERRGYLWYNEYNFPEDIYEMEHVWNEPEATIKLNSKKKRLLLICPEESNDCLHSWESVADWEYTSIIGVKPGEGLSEISWDPIIDYVYLLMYGY